MVHINNGQLIAVAEACKHFTNGEAKNNNSAFEGEKISCEICYNWDGMSCSIDVFDNVLMGIDNTATI